VGADILFQPPDASFILALNNSPVDIKIGDLLREVEGVKAVAPVLTMQKPGGGFNIIYGLDMPSWDAASGGFEYIDGGPFTSPNDVLIDDIYAASEGIGVGTEIELLNRKFRVCGVVENGKGSRIFIPLATAQEMNGREGRASLFFIKLNDKKDVKTVIEQRLGPGTKFENFKKTDVDAFASLMMSSNSTLMDAFFKVIVFVGVCIGVLVIFLSMYTTITERTREIGILRSLGASKGFIVVLILQESLLLCIAGVVFGMGASFVLARVIKALFPTLVVLITSRWLIQATIFAILSGLIGSFYPAIKAATKDPVEALAYE
jgi:putative ABC transport system permease protein